MQIEIEMDTIVDTRWIQILRVRFSEEMQFFLVTPWFTLKSGWL